MCRETAAHCKKGVKIGAQASENQKENNVNLTETIKSTPLQAELSVRRNEIRALTSAKAGKIIPLAYVPLLREDRMARGKVRVRFEMSETVKTLMNAINVTVYAHFVPFLAFEQFNGLDQFNRSYAGKEETPGQNDPIPFFQTSNNAAAGILKTMGVHIKPGSVFNASVFQAYNAIVNFRRKARSSKLPLRSELTGTVATGFWKNTGLAHIVPDFDQAAIDGELDLNIASAQLPVKGLSILNTGATASGTGKETGEASASAKTGWVVDNLSAGNAGRTQLQIEQDAVAAGFPGIYAELADKGITLSLSNIELAKKTAAFAAIRKKYSGLDDEHWIDLLMQSIRIPDAQMSQPILLDRKSTIMGYTRRYATDAANLEKSVTNGETMVELNMRTPPMNTGGIVMITAEIVPEQMFERQQDYFMTTKQVDELPNFTRDFLDPEKVAVVPNKHVDVEHTDPDGTFGYAPLNHQWNRNVPNIGGKFMRVLGDPFDENRQRIWSSETVDPALTSDFYLANNIHHDVFADNLADPFEITTIGACEIVGNTVFGKGLSEDTGDYDHIMDQVDQTRVDQTA